MSNYDPAIFGESDDGYEDEYNFVGDERPRCAGTLKAGPYKGNRCNHLLAEFVTRPWRIKCRICKYLNVMD